MPTKQLLRVLPLALAAAVLSPAAMALGLGAGPTSVQLGQALDFAVTVRLAADETLPNECVQAEVLVGERRISAESVRTRVQASGSNSATLRVSTSMPIDEPIVSVNLAVGCGTTVSRRYVVFADPGPALAPSAPVVAVVPAASVAPSTTEAAASAPGPVAPLPPDARLAAAPTRPLAGAEQAAAPPRRTAPRRAAPQRSATSSGEPRQRARPARQQETVRATALSAASPRAEARPRLQLEPADARALPPEPSSEIIEAAIAAVAQAASAARAAASAASASAERIAALERTVARVSSESQARQLEVDRLRALLSRPQPSNAWMLPLLLLLALLSLAAAWLVWRLRAMQRAQEVAWARVAAPEPGVVPAKATTPLPLITSELPLSSPLMHHEAVAAEGPRTTQPGILDIADTTIDDEDRTLDHAMARTVVLPPSVRVDDGAPRDVSIEELIDLEQQAEFFIALGQDSAAVDLLVAHLRNTGGGSPLTYLKLLEIYRRLDDQPAYERTRSRFNYRYNAYAPEWGVDLQTGRALEDYPGVLPRLEQAWSKPLDAMAELEALLFRKSRGELFDLPAYRDVLFLYSLARDLHEREPQEAGDVDLLLPLDGTGVQAASAHSRRADLDIAIDERPTAPIDLDLTPQASHESIFGEPLTPSPGFGRKPPPSRP